MLPAYLLLVVRGQPLRRTPGERTAVGRALAATVGMALGFMAVFGSFGALTISAASTVQRYLPYGTVVIGVVLVALGFWLLSGRELTALTPRPLGPRWAPDGSAVVHVRLRRQLRDRVAVVHHRAVSGGHRRRPAQWIDPHGRVDLPRLRRGPDPGGRRPCPRGRDRELGGGRTVAPHRAVREPDQWRAAGAGRPVRRLLRRLRAAAVQCDGGEPAGRRDHRGRPPAGCAGRLGAPARRMALGGGVSRW